MELYFKYSETGETQTSLLNLASGAFDGTEDVSANIGYYQDNWSIVCLLYTSPSPRDS